MDIFRKGDRVCVFRHSRMLYCTTVESVSQITGNSVIVRTERGGPFYRRPNESHYSDLNKYLGLRLANDTDISEHELCIRRERLRSVLVSDLTDEQVTALYEAAAGSGIDFS